MKKLILDSNILETQAQWWLAGLFFYMVSISCIGMISAYKYLKSEPLKIAKQPELALSQFQHKERESNALTGFALVGVIFIITFFQGRNYSLAEELLLTFFSLAFIFEVISALMYRMVHRGIYGFLGSLFQYGGILSMIMGFGTFMFQVMNWSFYLNTSYLLGISAVIILSGKGFIIQIKNWRSIVDPILLNKLSIRGFTPKTYGTGNDVERKVELRDKIRSEINNIQDIQKACRGKRISLDVCFYLYNDPSESGRSQKDLDNLLKILCDVLPEHMIRDKSETGLGLIEDDRDDLIFKINCRKELVSKESEEGLDLEISQYK